MAVKNELFLFEIVLQRIIPLDVEDRLLVIKGDFADIFSLEMKDPKSMKIVIPDPPPLPPEPPGKKKKKPPKPKKPKKGKEPPPPPEPEILAGQSVLFTSSPEVLVQNMRNNPLEISLYSKEENLTYIGCSKIPWDEIFLKYLERIFNCMSAVPAVVKDDYNIFEEHTGKLIARMTMQVKLTYLTDRIVSCFRTLTEDPIIKKVLYTGMNSKTTSFMCTLKTTEEEFASNIAKIPNKYIIDKQPTQYTGQPVVYADFTNAPSANLPTFPDGNYCCKGSADKAPDPKINSADMFYNIDYICDYVRKIISSCNDNMRMLTPRPAIKPRTKATDLDKLCYCAATGWPQGDLAERFRKETQGGPCPICVRSVDGKPRPGTAGAPSRTLDIANIRGPCGRPDCRIARDIRAYLEKIVEEDSKEIVLDEIVGPCGSKDCTLVDKIKDFLQHKGKFTHGASVLGMGTQCACIEQMQNALIRSGSCTSICSHDCGSDEYDNCGGKACPYTNMSRSTPSPKSGSPKKTPGTASPAKSNKDEKPPAPTDHSAEDKKPDHDKKVYYVYYFTVEYAMTTDPKDTHSDKTTSDDHTKASTKTDHSGDTSPSPSSKTAGASTRSGRSEGTTAESNPSGGVISAKGQKYKYCADKCPIAWLDGDVCSKSVCGIAENLKKTKTPRSLSCTNIKCPTREAEKQEQLSPSPADSDVELKLSDIRNPCCVKSCDVSERVKDIIMEGMKKKVQQKSKFENEADPCFCDCVCEFPLGGQTTYCSVCGGYEFLGNAVKEQPAYLRPHPCPVYHKLKDSQIDKLYEDRSVESVQKSGKGTPGKTLRAIQSGTKTTSVVSEKVTDQSTKEVKKKTKKKGKFTSSQPSAGRSAINGHYHKYCHSHFDSVPKYMGWLWTAEDIPGMKNIFYATYLVGAIIFLTYFDREL